MEGKQIETGKEENDSKGWPNYCYCCKEWLLEAARGPLLIFPGGSDRKEFDYNAADLDSIPELSISPGEGMATHFSILAWRTPWTEEPGGI